MAGSGNSAGALLAWASAKAGTGRPAAESSVLAMCFRWEMVVGQVPAARERHPGQLEGPDDVVLVPGVAVDALRRG